MCMYIYTLVYTYIYICMNSGILVLMHVCLSASTAKIRHLMETL